MASSAAVLALVAGCLVASASAADCVGATDSRFDGWCDVNCNNDPPHCPAEFCTCDGATAPVAAACRSTGTLASDEWCNMVCNFNPPFCPDMFCVCDSEDTGSTDPFDYALYWEVFSDGNTGDVVCCDENADEAVLWYTENDGVFKIDLNSSNVTECATVYGDPNDIAIDQDGDAWVPSRVSGKLFRITQNCSNVYDVFGWPNDGVKVGGSVTFAANRLYVAAETGILRLVLNEDKEVISFENTGLTPFHVSTMTTYNNCIYYTTQDKNVMKYCPLQGNLVTTFVTADDYRLPDIQGVAVTECGAFITATDLNQIFFCDGVDQDVATSCVRLCEIEGIDADTCDDLANPWGVAVGCCCDIYVASRQSGTIVVYDGRTRVDGVEQVGEIVLDGLDHPKALAFFAPPPPCVETLSCTPPPSATPTASASASTSSSQTMSQTATTSNTPSPSPSTSQTTSQTMTTSPSQTSSSTASSSPSTSQSPSQTPSTTGVPNAAYCLDSTNAFPQIAVTGDDITVTVESGAPIDITNAVCAGLPVSLNSSPGRELWTVTITYTGGLPDGAVISCVFSAVDDFNRPVPIPAENENCTLTVRQPPQTECVINFGPGVDTCLGVRENATVTITSDSPGEDFVVSLVCAGTTVSTENIVTPANIVALNNANADNNLTCTYVVSTPEGLTDSGTCTIETCPPVGRFVGDVQRPSQSGFLTSSIATGVVSTQLLSCVDLEPGVIPSDINCRSQPEEVSTVYDVPTVFLQLLLNGRDLTPVGVNGANIRLIPLVPQGDPEMCVIYGVPVFFNATSGRTEECNPLTLFSGGCGNPAITPTCTSGIAQVDKENDILPRLVRSFTLDVPEAQARLTPNDFLSILATFCPDNIVTEYAVSYVHYQRNGLSQTADKPALGPRPTYVDDQGVTRAPALCIDANDHPLVRGRLMNSTKGSIICIQDRSLVLRDTSQLTVEGITFVPPSGEDIFPGDILPIDSTGDNKDVRACPFRAAVGGTREAEWCANPPPSRLCLQYFA